MEKEFVYLYNNLLSYNGYISVCDVEFESSVSFDANIKEFTKAYKESPEYFTDEMIVSIYHLIKTGDFIEACEIVGEIECLIVGRTSSDYAKYGLDLVDDGYEWIDMNTQEQIKVVAKNIKNFID